MKTFLFSIALLLCHKGSAHFLDEECGSSRSSGLGPRITYGHEAQPGTTPWMAAVSNDYRFICGGTLITKNFVLTAAHCIHRQRQLFVRLGVYDRSCATWSCRGVEHYNVIRAIMHTDYDSIHYTSDIGLLELNAEVQYKDHIRPICIVIDDSINLRYINRFTVFGWGKTETGQDSQLLMTISLFRRFFRDCQYTGTMQHPDKQICAGKTGGDTCVGDSGGPLGAILGDRYVQVGLVSYGSLSCNAPAIYTDVASYKDWIASNVRRISQADTSYPGIELSRLESLQNDFYLSNSKNIPPAPPQNDFYLSNSNNIRPAPSALTPPPPPPPPHPEGRNKK